MSLTDRNPNGQATMANSAPVVLASDHSSVPVSDVDTLAALSNLSSIVHAEGDAHGDGDSGVPMWAVRKDTPAPLSSDGEYHVLETDANGRLHVLDQNSAAALTALQLIDDAIHSGDAALSKYAVIGAVFDDAATVAVTENQAQSLRMSSRRALLIEGVASGTAVAVSVATIPSHAVTNAGTFVVQENGAALTALQLIDNAVSGAGFNITQLGGAAVPIGAGTESTAVRVTLPTNGTGLVGAQGNVAHDAADTGNPVKVGGKAVAWAATPTAVAAADRTDQLHTLSGQPFVMPGHPNIICKEFTVLDSDGAQTNLTLVDPAAGKRLIIMGCTVRPDNANTGDVAYRIGLAASTLSAASLSGITGIFASSAGDAAGSGISGPPSGCPIAIGAADHLCLLTCEDPVGGALRIIIWYFESD